MKPGERWRWLSGALVVDEGPRPVVLMASRLRGSDQPVLTERGPEGLLVGFDFGSQRAKVIEAAPELADALREVLDLVDTRSAADQEKLDRAEALLARVRGSAPGRGRTRGYVDEPHDPDCDCPGCEQRREYESEPKDG